MSAFEVYLIFTLNSICKLFFAFCVFSFIGFWVSVFIFSESSSKESDSWSRAAKINAAIFVFSSILVALTPSSQTAAAMWLIPALTNEKMMQQIAPEAKEIYGLAKEALKKAVKEEK